MSVVPIPGYPGQYAVPELAAALVAAGSPPANSVTRLYAEQRDLYLDYLNGDGNPADNPDDESQNLAHVRGTAVDIDPTPDRIRRLAAAGLVRPYAYEPWHWQLPGDVRRYPIIRSFPDTQKEWDDMASKDEIKAAVREVLVETRYGIGGRNLFDLGNDARGFASRAATAAEAGTAERIWNHDLTAQDAQGKPILHDGKPVKFKAWGFLTSAVAQATAALKLQQRS